MFGGACGGACVGPWGGGLMYIVRVSRVLSEDPWRTTVLLERRLDGDRDPFTVFDDVVASYIGRGYVCSDYGASTRQLCTRVIDDRRIDRILIEMLPATLLLDQHG